MKILHIGKYYYPYHGGMESVVKDLCEGLVKENQEVEVLCSHTLPVSKNEVINKVKVSRVFRLGTLLSQSLTPSLLTNIFFKSKKFDVVHLHCPNPLAELASLFIPKNVPLVITYHSDIIRQKAILPFYRPLQKKILNRAQKIIVPTLNHINCSDILPEYREKCEVIPFGLNTEFMPELKTLETKASALKEKYGKYALFVGRLVGYKGLDVLIEACRHVEDKVLIVGQGPENDRLRDQIKKLGLTDKVKMLGRVEDLNEFWSYYLGSEFFILPSITSNENFGVVQLEAMYCSKAVITTNLKSGVPLVGEKGKTSLLVNPNNSEQLGKAMQMLFSNPELAQKMGKAGKARFNRLYTYEKMIESHINLYNNLLGRNLRKAKEDDSLLRVS